MSTPIGSLQERINCLVYSKTSLGLNYTYHTVELSEILGQVSYEL